MAVKLLSHAGKGTVTSVRPQQRRKNRCQNIISTLRRVFYEGADSRTIFIEYGRGLEFAMDLEEAVFVGISKRQCA